MFVSERLIAGFNDVAMVRESIHLIIPEGLISSAIRQAGAIADRVIDVVGLVHGRTGGRELVQDVAHLAGRSEL